MKDQEYFGQTKLELPHTKLKSYSTTDAYTTEAEAGSSLHGNV